MPLENSTSIAIPGYQTFERIYQSLNSEVYRAIAIENNRPVILKLLQQDYPTPQELTRYKQEYEITRRLNLEGTIKAYSLQAYQRTLCIILEDFGGDSLKQWIKRQRFTLSEFLAIAIQIANHLGAIHAANIIHKDINPANLVFNPETGQLKIIDFGISSQLTRENPTLKNPRVLEGTLAYMSPEQTGRMNRTLDYRSDFYSLGVTFYELLTQKLPFETSDPLELVHCHIAKPPIQPDRLNPDIPKAVSNIAMKLMAKTAEDRYQSAWGLKADLERCLNQLQETGTIAEFPLGSHDVSDRFQIPQKLYGREREVETLLAAFNRVAATENRTSKIELMLVAGYSGIGKSSLVAELYKPITEKRGYFISGKFDQFKRNIPYSAAIAALTGLVRQLLTESESQLTQWREKLLTALGNNGQTIVNVIPEVELIIGSQPPVPELGPTESLNRFNLVFQNFIRALGTKEHPLTIFLDDLQWADSASLKLIELMMTDDRMEYLFLIGAYRNNEVSRSHPLMMCLDGLRKEGAAIEIVTLTPLTLNDVSQSIADTLHQDPNAVKPLAKLVRQKTQGNPFFVNIFLKTLHAEDLLSFDLSSLSWQWDLDRIEAMGITDNVVELTLGKLKKLPESTREVLRLAACVGAEFDITTLEIISKQSVSDLFEALKPAIEAELIWANSELEDRLLIHDYRFVHDRVQQAAYALIDASETQAINLKIGRLLWKNRQDTGTLAEDIFTIVDRLNLGLELLDRRSEKIEIARLNWMAGEKAKSATAYESAIVYFSVALDLLPEDCWQTEYDLTLSLYIEATETYYLTGDFEAMERFAAIVWERGQTLLEKLRVQETKMQAYAVQNRFSDGLDIGLECLQLLGIHFPTHPDPQEVAAWLDRTQSVLDRFTPEELLNLPEMSDPAMKAAMRILTRVISLSYFGRPTLLPLICCQGILLSIESGNAMDTPVHYVNYGQILCYPTLSKLSQGYRYGKLGERLLAKQGNKQFKPFTFNNYNSYVVLWTEPIQNTLEPLKDAYKTGLETGDVEYGAYAIGNYFRLAYSVGRELSNLKAEMESGIEFMHSIKFEGTRQYTLCMLQTVLNLMGEAEEPWVLQGTIYDAKTSVPFFESSGNLLGLSIYYFNQLTLNYHFDRIESAVEAAIAAERYIDSIGGHHPLPQFGFYAPLAYLAAMERVADSQKQTYLERANHWCDRLQHWAENAPHNFLHKYHLVLAEKARIEGNNWQATQLYEQAISGAKENRYIQEEALAYELAAQFYRCQNMSQFAQTYTREAYYAYQRWGCVAKVKQFERQYPQIATQLASISATLDPHKTNTSTASRSGNSLDFATVVKASQAISSEIVRDKLLAKLMKITIENAGAQLGYLILEEAGELRIEASGSIDDDRLDSLQSLPIESRLPVSLVNYAIRTGESVVLNDATSQGNFTADPYIQTHHPKSILCVPLVDRGKLVNIIYLENNLTVGAFTRDRLEVVKVLSSQAAISIENATLYRKLEEYSHTLETKVEERTAQLAAAYSEINALNQRLTAENIRMSAELEITRKLQQMILPTREEIREIEELEIAGFMEPAEEVGGDYYDILQNNGRVKIGIGDVTGHGLESGILMIMVQTAVRTLLEIDETDPVKFLDALNRTLYKNVERMSSDKNMTLCLLDYQSGTVTFSGQHEEVILVRAGGKVEPIDTIDLGLPIGLISDIADLIGEIQVQLNPGDGMVLYTDGITEAKNAKGVQYGLERLCNAIAENWERSPHEIQKAIVDNLRQHIGSNKLDDDITLVVFKQK